MCASMAFFQRTVDAGWFGTVKPLLYGYQKCLPGHSFGPAIRHYYLLHYVLDGEGDYHARNVHHIVQKGDIFVICPNEVTTYRASEEFPWSYAWLGFEAAFAPAFLSEPVLRQLPVRHLFERIHDFNDFHDNIFSLAHDILWRLSKAPQKGSNLSCNYAAHAKSYIDLSYMEPVSIQNIAKNLHIDRRYLTVLFREAYGIAPQTYLMQLRLNRSKEFLEQGYSVTEASAMAGFSDLSNFSRCYKAHFGMCPSQQNSVNQP